MSYVDLMGDHRWTEAEHIARTENLVREHWSPAEEWILNVKVLGAAEGQNVLMAQDQADMQSVKAVRLAAQSAGIDARVDAARVSAALDYEAARQALAAMPPVPGPDPDTGETPVDPYAEERAALQAQLDAATADTLQLVADRDAYRASLTPPEDPPSDPPPQEPAP